LPFAGSATCIPVKAYWAGKPVEVHTVHGANGSNRGGGLSAEEAAILKFLQSPAANAQEKSG